MKQASAGHNFQYVLIYNCVKKGGYSENNRENEMCMRTGG